MNNDLYVKGAIDEVKGVVDELHKLSGGAGLPAGVHRTVEKGLRKIDSVRGVIFPRAS